MIIASGPEGDILICYGCWQETGDEFKLMYWLPDDPENYPAECEQCKGTMVAPGEWEPTVMDDNQ